MRKRRALVLSVILALALSVCAGAVPRYDDGVKVTATLSYSDTTARCGIKVEVEGGSSVKANMTLFHVVGTVATEVHSWFGLTGSGGLNYSDTFTVTQGETYRLTASATVNGKTYTNSIDVPCD